MMKKQNGSIVFTLVLGFVIIAVIIGMIMVATNSIKSRKTNDSQKYEKVTDQSMSEMNVNMPEILDFQDLKSFVNNNFRIGQKIGGLNIESMNEIRNNDKDTLSIKFSGQKTITGKYYFYFSKNRTESKELLEKKDKFFYNKSIEIEKDVAAVCFEDIANYDFLAITATDASFEPPLKFKTLCLELNPENAELMNEKFGSGGSFGQATVTLDNYEVIFSSDGVCGDGHCTYYPYYRAHLLSVTKSSYEDFSDDSKWKTANITEGLDIILPPGFILDENDEFINNTYDIRSVRLFSNSNYLRLSYQYCGNTMTYSCVSAAGYDILEERMTIPQYIEENITNNNELEDKTYTDEKFFGYPSLQHFFTMGHMMDIPTLVFQPSKDKIFSVDVSSGGRIDSLDDLSRSVDTFSSWIRTK
ncbi:MAG: hypothetical protein PHW52_03615 [Candidatus Pacebacteria bacterium]|nr:hypothetical protein [Candidatus Paceibacterota bacterium]